MAVDRRILRRIVTCAPPKGGGDGLQLGPAPILLEDFESTTGFTGGTNQTATAPTDAPPQGAAYLKSKAIAVSTGQTITAFKTKATQFDPAAAFGDHIALCYKVDPFATNSISVELARGGTAFSNFNDAFVNSDNKPRGWKWGSQALTGLISGVGAVQIRARAGTRNPSNAESCYDALLVGPKPKGRVTFGFDDNHKSQYSIAFPYMQARNVKGQINVARDLIGAISWRLQVADLQEMYAAGWAMCLNTGNDFGITWAGFGGDPAGVVTEFQAARAYNLGLGFTYGSDCLVYSEGIYQTEPVVCHGTAITADGSTTITITTISGTQIPVAGMKMTSFQLDGPVIQSVVGAAVPFTVVLDTSIPATVTRAAFYDDSGNFTPKNKDQTPAPAPLALQNAGFKLGRTTIGGSMYIDAGFADQALQANGQGASLATYAQLQAYVDAAIANGTWVHFYFHNVNGGTAIDIDMSILGPLIDYCVTKRTAGVLDIITAPDAVAIAESGKARMATLVAVT
jgi:hypothetical protein